MRKAEAARALGRVAWAGLLTLAGCDLAPHYVAPPLAVPAAYKEVPAGWVEAQPGAALPKRDWWIAFGDPVLNDLETRAEAGNPSLAASVARYDEALGQLGLTRSDLFPTVQANGSASRQRVSENTPIASRGLAYNDYTVGGSVTYELDLFGRIRNQVRANRGEVQATAAEIAGTRLGLQAMLATSYFQVRGADARLALLGDTVREYQRAYDLTMARHAGGIASGIDTSRARAQLSGAKAEISATRAQRAAYEHAVAALTGVPASGFAIVPVAGVMPAPPAVPAGTPSTLLQRRPDIDVAERRVYEANRRIGVARAAFFPVLTLGAQGGFETVGPKLLSTASSFWALGPAMAALTLLDGGARRSQVRIARARFEEAAANYKQTVLTAFRETEDDLANARNQVTQLGDLADATRAAERTRDLALVRYRDGASDYLEVVTAQTAALDSERSLIDLRTQRLLTMVDTVRALGGPPAA